MDAVSFRASVLQIYFTGVLRAFAIVLFVARVHRKKIEGRELSCASQSLPGSGGALRPDICLRLGALAWLCLWIRTVWQKGLSNHAVAIDARDNQNLHHHHTKV